MKLISCKTPNEVATQTVAQLRRIDADSQNGLSVFVPTGSTPKPIYAALVAQGGFWTDRLRPIQIDEFIDAKRLFYAQLNTELIKPLRIAARARLIDPTWTEAQMFTHVDQVLSAPIDCALLGLGPNGHVGFHEPGYPLSFLGGRLQVTQESWVRVPEASTAEVYTFGVQAFMQAREILVVVIGESKRQILKQVLAAEPRCGIPAAFLKLHERFTVISDVL